MSYNEGTVVCPLCQTRVPAEGGGDALQLHYLTNCSGYDKGTVSSLAWSVLPCCLRVHTIFTPSVPSERPPKAASQEEPLSTTKSYLDHTSASVDLPSSAASASASPSYYTRGSASIGTGRRSSVGDSAGATGGDSGDGSTSSVQFMWQPLSDINYPSITLLASFKVSMFLSRQNNVLNSHGIVCLGNCRQLVSGNQVHLSARYCYEKVSACAI